jgi:serine/threonine protein kinase/Tol biopolymer transport system component
MVTQTGTKVGHYKILAMIGKGGMGEVYRAHDTELARDVAIKVLPLQFERDPERIARFRREATMLAALNHSNIAQIYGVEASSERHYLIMELVPGITLAGRILSGPVEFEDALRTCSQIAEALEHAHEKNIIHRDLKPANVKLTPEGKVKVLDFGLAKAFAPDASEKGPPDSNSPTMSEAATAHGVILGTAAYMSPEQAKGKTLDRRTDIWSLGCILFELLTGRPAFTGDSVTEILGSVLKAEPDWTALPEGTPSAIRALLRRCLRKDVQQRPRDAADIRLELEDVLAASSPPASIIVTQSPVSAPRRRLLIGALACVALGAMIAAAVWNLRPMPAATAQTVERLTINLRPNTQLASMDYEMAVLSPDGSRLVYVASASGGTPQLYLRAMDSFDANPIPGSEGAGNPFFSPDGRWIGFYTAGKLKKVSANGGAALTLCSVVGFRGAAWGTDDTIVFATNNAEGLWQVPASGGRPQKFSVIQQGESDHRWPQFLPDGQTVVYTARTTAGNPDEGLIVAQRLSMAEHKTVVRGGTYGRYVPTGHLVFYRAGTIMAAPFDLKTVEVKGTPAPVLDGVMSSSTTTGAGQFSFSKGGSLIYLSGTPQSGNTTLMWVDRHGNAQALAAPPRNYRAPRLSPDGKQVTVGIGNDIWLYDIARDTLSRFTFEGNNALYNAVWTPDGKRIVFSSDRAGPPNSFWKAADGSGPEERLTTSTNNQRASSFSPDGHLMAYTDVSPKTGSDLWILPLDGDRKPRLFLQTPFQESSAQISPEGHWAAYISDESGRLEVYVRPFPGSGGKWQVSTDGGTEVAWSSKGNELFYRTGNRREKMMVVEVHADPTFSAGKPQLLFEGSYVANSGAGALYSVSPDAQRFLMTKAPEQQSAYTEINVVLNWFEDLKKKVPK